MKFNPLHGLKHFFSRDSERTLMKSVAITIISLAVFLAGWWALSSIFPSAYFPSPYKVGVALINSFENPDPNFGGLTMWDHMSQSLGRFLWGFVVAFVLALPLGLLLGFSKVAENLGKPIVEIFRPIPPIAWAPFFFVIFGVFWGPILPVFLGVFFPVLSNVIFGVKSVDPLLLDVAKTQGASKLALFRKVILPSTIPYMMTGIRIGLGIGWMCIVAAEMIVAPGGGIGLYISIMSLVGRWDYMFAGMVVIAILGILTAGLSGYIERRVSKWMGIK
ncbi:MAG: ABC transporter permease [Methanomassiliicoccales archaeon]|jgi:NitT/TauT family transport system permease protein